ncbi:alginate lyase family protein [Domibacillus indicus]|uniref:alginate lyase family protein n=1 Tax=Domibacillus indicus TaxID=1437523 RepID=UPI000617E4FC|nr:alginate lyase family protein [Domibacillus indicus]
MKDKLEMVQNMGLSWTAFRVKYEIEKKLGLLKKQFPAFSYEEMNIHKVIKSKKSFEQLVEEAAHHYFFNEIPSDYAELKDVFQIEQAIKEADEICNGTFQYFSKHAFSCERVNWQYSPHTQKSAPHDVHWTDIADLGSEFGDIKWIWELSRFSFVYPLVRAYVATGNDQYAETFWRYFEDFVEHNPPELGANYKCGQEMSFRLMAWTFGLFAFRKHPSTTEKRLEVLMKAIYHHADHIEKHFDFALKSVKNNHSLSEAAGMYTAGVLFPFFDKAEKWRKTGKKYIRSEAMWQIYEDGSYIQHSFNYQRLAIQDLTWVVRLSQISNDSFDDEFLKRFGQTVLFMYQHQDLQSGRLPNYGMNDGAYIHPLTSCDYLDHRPALQVAWHTLNGTFLYDDQSVNEIVYWLSGDSENSVTQMKQSSQAYPLGGYYTLRTEDSFGVIRSATYKHRPAQADMLHFDLWHQGENILADAGTFSYNTDMDHILYFNGTASHNTVMVNNQDQMKKASRFIWLNWTKSKTLRAEKIDNMQIFEGEHYGYGSITHRRGVIQVDEQWIIVDDIFGSLNNEEISLGWLFGIQKVEQSQPNEWLMKLQNDEEWSLNIFANQKTDSQLYKGNVKPLRGWRSLYYGDKEPFPQAVLKADADKFTRFVTVAGPSHLKRAVSSKQEEVFLAECTIKLNKIGNQTIFKLR